MEERADRDIHGGPAAATASPQVPQQIPLGCRGTLKATSLPQEQQWPLNPLPMERVPGESTSSGQSTWAAQSSECSLGEKCEDEGRSCSPLGCSVAGLGPGLRDASTRSGDHRQARGCLLPPKGLCHHRISLSLKLLKK